MEIKKKVKSLSRNTILCYSKEKPRSGKRFSKIGGKPELPKEFAWFRNTEKYGNNPLSFVAQFDCQELKKYDKDAMLPDYGFIYFFYDYEAGAIGCNPEDAGCARVYYYEGSRDELVETELPKDLKEEYRIPELSVTMKSAKDYPMREDYNAITSEDVDYDDFDRIYDIVKYPWHAEDDIFKLLGYAELLQRSMLLDLPLVTRGVYTGSFDHIEQRPLYAEERKDWILLCQIGLIETSDFSLEIGDMGIVYFYIREQDLMERKFDKIWFGVQSR